MDIKPIHSKADHKRALEEIERLWDCKPGTPEGDRFEVLAVLVDAYESKHMPVPPPDPIEAIKFRLEQQGKARADLEPILGTRARVSEVLNGRRRLTLTMIRALHRELSIPLEVLILDTMKPKGLARTSPRPAVKSPARKARTAR